MRRWSTVSTTPVRVVSINSAAEFTVTDSFPPATPSVTGSSSTPPTVITTPGAVAGAKPDAVTVTVYEAGGSACALYAPAPLLAADRSIPFASSRTVTDALVTKFPCGSFTVTWRSPVATPWPKANVAAKIGMRVNSESNLGIRIEILQGENSLSGQPGPSGVGWRTKLLEAKVRWFLHHFVEGKQARYVCDSGTGGSFSTSSRYCQLSTQRPILESEIHALRDG